MPTYLRWIAAITTGITTFFAYSILTLGLVRASGRTTLTSGPAGLLSLVGGLLMMVATLAMNDWLIRRYPPVGLERTADREDEGAPTG